MPVMDGFEACRLIYNYLNDSESELSSEQPLLPSRVRKSPTLLYCLSADFSPQTHKQVKALPFDEFINVLRPDAILEQVKKMKKKFK